MDTNKEKWVLLMVLTLIWGSSFILIKKSLQHFNPFEVGAMRILIASLILMPLAIKHLKSFPIKQLKWVVVVALCGNFFSNVSVSNSRNQNKQQHCRNYQFYAAYFRNHSWTPAVGN